MNNKHQPRNLEFSRSNKAMYSLQNTLIKNNKKTKYKTSNNPTLITLKDLASKHNVDELFEQYTPFVIKKPQSTIKDIFKCSTTLLTPSTQISLLATNDATTCSGDENKHILKFKRIHDWPLNESLVCFSYTPLNSPEADDKTFCMCIPTFLHTFKNKAFLKELFMSTAQQVSEIWNENNSDADKAGRRISNEIAYLFDFRKNPYSKVITESVLAATSFNHTLRKQNTNKKTYCRPEEVYHQLRYQTSEGKIKKGMVVLSRDEWISLIESEEFNKSINDDA